MRDRDTAITPRHRTNTYDAVTGQPVPDALASPVDLVRSALFPDGASPLASLSDLRSGLRREEARGNAEDLILQSVQAALYGYVMADVREYVKEIAHRERIRDLDREYEAQQLSLAHRLELGRRVGAEQILLVELLQLGFSQLTERNPTAAREYEPMFRTLLKSINTLSVLPARETGP